MKMYELLSDPAKWTQGTLARDAGGVPCSVDSARARSFCLQGAMLTCYENDLAKEKVEALQSRLRYAVYQRGANGVGSYNDAPDRTHEEVLALCRELDI